MFSAFTNLSRFMTRTTIRRTGMIAAAGAALAMVAPLAMADDWRGRGRGHDRGHERRSGTSIIIRPEIIIGARRPDVVVVERRAPARRVEVMPEGLSFKAYQAHDRIILNVEGFNRGEGFITELAACHGDEVELTNLAPYEDCGTGRKVDFCLTGSLTARRALHCITVRVAGRTFTVPVIQAKSLN
jgi:hypothetical protein